MKAAQQSFRRLPWVGRAPASGSTASRFGSLRLALGLLGAGLAAWYVVAICEDVVVTAMHVALGLFRLLV